MVHCHESTYRDFYFFPFLSWLSAGLCPPRYFDTNIRNDKERIFMKDLTSLKKKKLPLDRLLFSVVRC